MRLLFILLFIIACGKNENQYLPSQVSVQPLIKKLEKAASAKLTLKKIQLTFKRQEEQRSFSLNKRVETLSLDPMNILKTAIKKEFSLENKQLLIDMANKDYYQFLSTNTKKDSNIELNMRSQLWTKNFFNVDKINHFKVNLYAYDGKVMHKIFSKEINQKFSLSSASEKIQHHFDLTLSFESRLINRRSKIYVEFEQIEVIEGVELYRLARKNDSKYRVTIITGEQVVDVWYRPDQKTLKEVLSTDFNIQFDDNEIVSILGQESEYRITEMIELFNLTKPELSSKTILSWSNSNLEFDIAPKAGEQYVFFSGSLGLLKKYITVFEKVGVDEYFKFSGSSSAYFGANTNLQLPASDHFQLDLYNAYSHIPQFKMNTGRVGTLYCRDRNTGRGHKKCSLRRSSSHHCYYEKRDFSHFEKSLLNIKKFEKNSIEFNDDWNLEKYIDDQVLFVDFEQESKSTSNLFYVKDLRALGNISTNYVVRAGTCSAYNMAELPTNSFSSFENVSFKMDLYRLRYFDEVSGF